jgi:hypothetical protein
VLWTIGIRRRIVSGTSVESIDPFEAFLVGSLWQASIDKSASIVTYPEHTDHRYVGAAAAPANTVRFPDEPGQRTSVRRVMLVPPCAGIEHSGMELMAGPRRWALSVRHTACPIVRRCVAPTVLSVIW